MTACPRPFVLHSLIGGGVMKTVMFDDREIQLLRAIVIDKDREEAR
jgi:hypothetical protein